jgi:myo-inositol catabolism protein IolC
MTGFSQPLAVMAFDHRKSFAQLMGSAWPMPAPARERAAHLKSLILAALEEGIATGVPRNAAAALVDEELGAHVAEAILQRGLALAMPVEATGADRLRLQYGKDFAAHLERFQPDFVKVLLRRNPAHATGIEDDEDRVLRALAEWVRAHGYQLMLEIVVPPLAAQLDPAGGGRSWFDAAVRPCLVVEVIEHLHDRGVEPHLWKLEGLETVEDCARVAAAVQRAGRDEVRCIVLGRGANIEAVCRWLGIARRVPAFSGFAIGRSLWWQPLTQLLQGRIDEARAVGEIAANYATAYRAFTTDPAVRGG